MVSRPKHLPPAQHGTEIPDDVDSSVGKPCAAGGLYIGVALSLIIWALVYAVACGGMQ